MSRGRLALLGLVVFVAACALATLIQGKGPACASFTSRAWADARSDRTVQRFARVNALAKQLEFCDEELVLGRSRATTRRLLGGPDEETTAGPQTVIYDIGYRGAYAFDSDAYYLDIVFDRTGRAVSVAGAAP